MPLQHFLEKYGVDISTIQKIVCGRKYSAVLLKNGNIGVCANLQNHVTVEIDDLKTPDLDKTEHRILLNAYYNATLNYSNRYEQSVDIFDGVDFTRYKNTVMVGLFRPLVQKFEDNAIPLSIFDLTKKDHALTPLEKQPAYVKNADAVILSSTTVFNRTFLHIVNSTGETCDIFLLGPSSIINRDMFQYKNIKKIFGSIFNPYDDRVLNTIKDGYGTKKFLPFGKKVSI